MTKIWPSLHFNLYNHAVTTQMWPALSMQMAHRRFPRYSAPPSPPAMYYHYPLGGSQVKKVIAPFYKTFLAMFKYYCLTPSTSIRGAFSIQPNQFGKMMQDAELAGNFISVEEIGKIFVLVNFESDKVRATWRVLALLLGNCLPSARTELSGFLLMS